MAAIHSLNPKAEIARYSQALAINIGGARGLQEVLRTNLGPQGTMKMLVSGAGDIKITKDGNVLLHEMQIQHPTAALIAKASTAQNDETGDGTTSTVLIIGELLKQAQSYIDEGVHPRVITDGYDKAQKKAIEFLDKFKISADPKDQELLLSVAKTALKTKVNAPLAEMLAKICLEAVTSIHKPNQPIDLFMVEILQMQHKTDEDTKLIKGLVLDHGARHPNMKKRLTNAYILTCNVSLEYEKTTVHSGFFYKSADEREKMVAAEKKFIEDRCKKIIELKEKVCKNDPEKNFVVINQQGIDPNSLDMLCRAGITALRRAKRRNMERLTKACGGKAMNSLDDLSPDCLGFAGLVYEHVLGEEKYTFIEELKNPESVTILIRGPQKYALTQIKDALYDGLRAIKNTIEDGSLIPGAGAFEIALHSYLLNYMNELKGKEQMGVKAYAEALMVIPKTLAFNSGYDQKEVVLKLLREFNQNPSNPIGLDLSTGEPFDPTTMGIFDNYRVKRQLLYSCTSIACNILLVDEIMRAGLTSLKNPAKN
ncbi:T-complex protein 1 subunit zeta [Sarcoptes scabiei]|uniref:T-complex protein 1 subunit zeta n=1 Tax=Sarcoptes scabiei TaxID=52283 RepID=A0A834R4X6_SARSC|nr:T-complex protein 1 subunit zeta [Sarcoptes scabiei]UXI15087.1 Endoplasmic reticulum resident protein 44 [Sarcoptes scabiei]